MNLYLKQMLLLIIISVLYGCDGNKTGTTVTITRQFNKDFNGFYVGAEQAGEPIVRRQFIDLFEHFKKSGLSITSDTKVRELNERIRNSYGTKYDNKYFKPLRGCSLDVEIEIEGQKVNIKQDLYSGLFSFEMKQDIPIKSGDHEHLISRDYPELPEYNRILKSFESFK